MGCLTNILLFFFWPLFFAVLGTELFPLLNVIGIFSYFIQVMGYLG